MENQTKVAPRTAALLRKRPTKSNQPAKQSAPQGPASGMMRIYTDDSPGIKVDPVVVLVGSLTFIASVFVLHIVGKYLKG